MNRNKGFTLVEILIVVIILGILAAIVIPQFTDAAGDARESALASDLQTLRSQIVLYKIQHLEQYPGEQTPAVAGIDVDNANFVVDLTQMSNAEGNQVAGAGQSAVNVGPYIQAFPNNPFVPNAATTNTISSGAAACPGDGATGWYLNTTNGKISANDADHKDM